jgi:hypothetical protein
MLFCWCCIWESKIACIFAATRLLSTLDLPAILVVLFLSVEVSVVKIYVGNLSFDAAEDDVRDAFEAHGNVASVNIVTDRETGRSRGFAFVDMPNDSEANAAIKALNLKHIGDRAITVNEARPREDRPRSGGGGSRSARGGGGRGGW